MTSGPAHLVGRYRVLRELGRGGMGVVYAARDERLDRDVAVKLLHDDAPGNLLAEARAAARVSHPRSCQIFEVDTHEGRPFLVMELLSGETLAKRLARGPLATDEAVDTVVAMLEGLAALHELGLMHRDLKPANVFLTPHGVKLVDFGLVRPLRSADAVTMSATLSGHIRGTPQYMAPEQVRGHALDTRTDIFSAGAVLFEAVTGQLPFRGTTPVEVLNAVVNDHPPSIAGSSALAALDRIIQRALAKAPDQRYASATDMARALRRVRQLPQTGVVPVLRSEVRVAVLPFRLLRPDAEIEFLALGLADAISHSMAQDERCLVRSPFVAARVVETTGDDLRRIGTELDVDVIMSGTLLRSGDRVRATAQLVDCATGRVTWSHAHEGPVGDVFELQDEVVRVAIGALPLLAGDAVAGYAAARLALSRALELAPDLAAAHYHFAQVETDQGQSIAALRRLLTLAERRRNDPELYAGLVLGCRYGGLLEASLAADEIAHRLDPTMPTSAVYTYWARGEYERVLATPVTVNDHDLYTLAFWTLNRIDEARKEAMADEVRHVGRSQLFVLRRASRLLLDGAIEQGAAQLAALHDGGDGESSRVLFPDGEATYLVARLWAKAGAHEQAVAALRVSVAQGFACVPGFRRDPWFAPLGGDPAFEAVMAEAEVGHAAAKRVFAEHNGPALLGVSESGTW